MDGMFLKLFQPVLFKHHKCLVEDAPRAVGQKEQRIIDVLEPVLSAHRLVVDPRVIQQDFDSSQRDIKYSLFYQLTRITRDRGALAHDDRLDALAMAVAYWLESMAGDNDKLAQGIKDRVFKKELQNFIGGVLGKKPKAVTWMGNNRGSR